MIDNTIDNIQAKTELNNGVQMPWLGLGTFKANEGAQVQHAVEWALDAGYRSVDTAAAYQNEQGVGRGIRNHRTPREEVFLTTKLWNDDQGYEPALAAFEASLQRLDLDYVDLYLVHWPVGGKIQDTWRAMEEIYEAGRARAIGVSNFLEHQLNELLEKADVVPAVNQIEFHPHLQQNDLVNFCADKGIQVEAWSPLIKGEAFDLPELEEIGKKHGKNAGQVVLRWQLQRRVVTIPKSVRREHIESNAQVFDFTLDEDDMAAIDALDQNRRTGPDPNTFGY